jgi:hypothetical protein
LAGFDHPLADAARREVIALHAAFEAWLGGSGPATDAAFARIEAALAPSFSMVGPDGAAHARGAVIAALRAAHGAKGRRGPFRIGIAEVELLHLEPPLAVLRYVEDQRQGDARTSRRSMALFRASGRAPAGVEWLTVHETWVAGGQPA